MKVKLTLLVATIFCVTNLYSQEVTIKDDLYRSSDKSTRKKISENKIKAYEKKVVEQNKAGVTVETLVDDALMEEYYIGMFTDLLNGDIAASDVANNAEDVSSDDTEYIVVPFMSYRAFHDPWYGLNSYNSWYGFGGSSSLFYSMYYGYNSNMFFHFGFPYNNYYGYMPGGFFNPWYYPYHHHHHHYNRPNYGVNSYGRDIVYNNSIRNNSVRSNSRINSTSIGGARRPISSSNYTSKIERQDKMAALRKVTSVSNNNKLLNVSYNQSNNANRPKISTSTSTYKPRKVTSVSNIQRVTPVSISTATRIRPAQTHQKATNVHRVSSGSSSGRSGVSSSSSGRSSVRSSSSSGRKSLR